MIYACATVQSPTGGEKDEKAPILYESNPADQSTNFDGKEITLYFNEWMQLDQIKNELIITPRQDIEYEANLNKQELTITLDSALADSTTYTFNFRKALKDITEGNIWEKPIIAFSTGPYLDSLQVSGTIINIKDNSPSKAYLVGLYEAKIDTANLRQGKPTYFTTTDENGRFFMRNLKAGQYKLYAFEDKNDNLINEPQSEAFGFYHKEINLADSLEPLNIKTYSRNEDTLKIKKSSAVGKDFVIQYNKGLSNYQILDPTDSTKHIYANDIDKSKNIQIYKENFPDLAYETDSTLLILSVTDSIQNKRTDSVYFKIRESRIKNDTIKIAQKPETKIVSGQQKFDLYFTKPVRHINYDSIQVRINESVIKIFSKKDLTLNYNKKKLTIETILDENNIKNLTDSIIRINQKNDSIESLTSTKDEQADTAKNEQNVLVTEKQEGGEIQNRNKSTGKKELTLYFGKAAFLGVENDSTKQENISISFKQAEEYGIIKGKVINAEFPYVIELLNKNYEIQDTIVNQKEFQFDYVSPGEYRMRLLKDENNNQKWDAGNPFTFKKEEEYIYYDQLITVKKNWEVIDQNFDFSVDNEVDNGEKEKDL
jgi:uncharacterized protein (DUF2141 family)